MLKYEFKEATEERKQGLLTEIISKYNVANRSEMIQALAHCNAIYSCSQEDFASHPLVGISSRQLRTHKKEFLDIYTASHEKYSDTPEVNVEGVIDENVLESVYENLLFRLKSPKTATKDIATLLEYFSITKDKFKQFTDFRNATLRGFMSDNLSQIIRDEQTAILIKSVIAESPFLYQGNERTVGNTLNAQSMDFNNPLVRLELQSFGLLFISLFNGNVTDSFINNTQSLRLLKLSAGTKGVNEYSHHNFDIMDGKKPIFKAVAPKMEQELIWSFGEKDGKEMYALLSNVNDKADTKTAIKLPKYEQVAEDYAVHLQVFPEMSDMPLKVLLARLDVKETKLKDKYKQYLAEIIEE